MRSTVALLLGFGLCVPLHSEPMATSQASTQKVRATQDSCVAGVLIGQDDPDGQICNQIVKPMLRKIYERWAAAMPEQVEPPRLAKGNAVVELQVTSDGKLEEASLKEHAPLIAMDDDALQSVKATTFDPFPTSFKMHSLKLQIRFNYNEAAEGQ